MMFTSQPPMIRFSAVELLAPKIGQQLIKDKISKKIPHIFGNDTCTGGELHATTDFCIFDESLLESTEVYQPDVSSYLLELA